MTDIPWLILDFDSTMIEVEGLDELAALALANRPDGAAVAAEIARITDLGMEGKLAIDESLRRRLALLEAGRAEVEAITAQLKQRITPSFRRNAGFFRRWRERIYVISNGFEEYVAPVSAELSISVDHVFANRFEFDSKGLITGFDQTRLMAQAGGKARQLAALGLFGEVIVIGDGMTDAAMKEAGAATRFCAYMGNVRREAVAAKADHALTSFDAFLNLELFPR